MKKRMAVADKNICVACGVCIRECPLNAISVWKGCHAVVDTQKCVGCAKCAKVCPAGCITVEQMEVAE